MKIYSEFSERVKHFNIGWFLIYATICFAVAYVFLESIVFAIPFICVGYLMERETSLERVKKQRREQLEQFRQFIDIVNGSMTATNKAVEICVDEAMSSMARMHMNRTKVYKELLVMQQNIHSNYQVSFADELLLLAERLDNVEIMNFARSVSACYGINNQGITDIIRNTSALIQESNQVEDEIYASISEAKNQALLMLGAPSIMLLLLKAGITDYMSKMYEDPIGMKMIWFCLLVNYAMFFVIQRIVRRGT